ncbi:hypothetical protein MHU86_6971 [Fragilaria crotonensis]|nr:hypothetical protein MHU86_6971 [Fragilaria crotonensis]
MADGFIANTILLARESEGGKGGSMKVSQHRTLQVIKGANAPTQIKGQTTFVNRERGNGLTLDGGSSNSECHKEQVVDARARLQGRVEQQVVGEPEFFNCLPFFVDHKRVASLGSGSCQPLPLFFVYEHSDQLCLVALGQFVVATGEVVVDVVWAIGV